MTDGSQGVCQPSRAVTLIYPPLSSSPHRLPSLVFQVESDYCLLLALPCGRDQEDVVNQTESLKAAFISYLQAKQAAGIINVPNPGSNQVREKAGQVY